MQAEISKVKSSGKTENLVYVITQKRSLSKCGLSSKELAYVKKSMADKKELIIVNQYNRQVYVLHISAKILKAHDLEFCRKKGDELAQKVKAEQSPAIILEDMDEQPAFTLALAEGLVLGTYAFTKYKTSQKNDGLLKTVKIVSSGVSSIQIDHHNAVIGGVCCARTLVNEPLSYLTAEQLGKDIIQLGKNYGFTTEVLKKPKIKSLKMGGILAVNKGSIDPPTFSIMEWKPKSAKKSKPIVLVGKGVVFDTGGLSLKPTPNSMDTMKCDMGGSAAVVGAMCAVAGAKLPVHVIGLVPATDNRPGGNAYVPGDVLTMFDGTTVEVLNTDAEGRLILADALTYAKRYEPDVVIDLATLTGAAAMAIGQYGIVSMHEGARKHHDRLKESGEKVYERLAEMPFWEEYGDLIKSEIADIKNLGGPTGGAITAGKFLHHFTDYPWIHLDIAGPAFLSTRDSYRGIGGTGVGVRLLFEFLSQQARG
jgi:leucyl aminopeptidase